jgi:tRNA(fMet)-specific endonuclease VapC
LAKRQVSVEMQTAVEEFLAKIEVLPWESAAARAYAHARVTLERLGKPLANMDLLIAAHAASLGAVLVTNDPTLGECAKHIDVRQTVNWADDVGAKS